MNKPIFGILLAGALVSSSVIAAAAGRPGGNPGTHGGGPSFGQFASPQRQTSGTRQLGPTHTTGQPNQTCGSPTAPNTPGNAASAPGSAFNPDGKAGTMYAGQQPQNSRNSASVSQYDVACSHQR